jgi:hypothetical protein
MKHVAPRFATPRTPRGTPEAFRGGRGIFSDDALSD